MFKIMITEEERKMLVADLCAKIPYGVKASCYRQTEKGAVCEYEKADIISYDARVGLFSAVAVNVNGDEFRYGECYYRADGIIPYLRPTKNMTAKERNELINYVTDCPDGCKYFTVNPDGAIWGDGYVEKRVEMNINSFEMFTVNFVPMAVMRYQEWMDSRHFDWRGLIKRGLALVADEGLYRKTKKGK